MIVVTLRRAMLALLLPGLVACGVSEEADRAYAREKCRAYGSEDSDAFRACADEALYYLRVTRAPKFSGGP